MDKFVISFVIHKYEYLTVIVVEKGLKFSKRSSGTCINLHLHNVNNDY